jgi:hypothetical protein
LIPNVLKYLGILAEYFFSSLPLLLIWKWHSFFFSSCHLSFSMRIVRGI